MNPSDMQRKPLHPLPNGRLDSLNESPGKHATHSPSKFKSRSPDTKKVTHSQTSITTILNQNRSSDSNLVVGTKDKPMRPRGRASNADKRVSFGGREVKLFSTEHEDSSPEVAPPPKSFRTESRSSPSPRRSSTNLRSNTVVAYDELENTPRIPNASTFFSEGTDENASPVPLRKSYRESFGLFVDEDITPGRERVSKQADDTTQFFPSFHSAADPRDGPSAMSSPGNVTMLVPALSALLEQDDDIGGRDKDTFGETFDESAINETSNEIHPQDYANENTNKNSNDENIMVDTYSAISRGNRSPHQPSSQQKRSFRMSNENARLCVDDSDGIQAENTPQMDDHRENASATSSRGNESEITRQIISMQNMIDEDEDNGDPSQLAQLPVREIPPESRKLFDSEANQEEDVTIHYHDDNHPIEENSPSQEDLVRNTAHSNHEQEFGGQSSTEGRPSNENDLAADKNIENDENIADFFNEVERKPELSSRSILDSLQKSNSATSSVQLNQQKAMSSFSIDDFLKAANIRFESNNLMQHRELSLAPDPNRVSLERGSFAQRIYASARKTRLLNVINEQIQSLKEEIDQAKSRIHRVESEIQTSTPVLYKKMESSSSLPLHELTSGRLSFKRLRKMCALHAKHDWVRGRQSWERSIHSALENVSASLEQDSHTSGEIKGRAYVLFSDVERDLEQMGVTVATDNNTEDMTEDTEVVQRRAVIQELSLVRDVRNDSSTYGTDKRELASNESRLTAQRAYLQTECHCLRSFATANTSSKIRKLVSERTELNIIVSGISGLQPLSLDKTAVSLRLNEMMDVKFSLHEDRVINRFCVATKQRQSANSHWQPYVEAATNILGSAELSKDVHLVRHLPHKLNRVSRAFLLSKITFEDAAMYFERHLGEITLGGASTHNGTDCVQLSAIASFYSISMRSKFDVNITVRTLIDDSTESEPQQSISVDTIIRHLGDSPSDDQIRAAIQNAKQTRNGAVCISVPFSALWKVLSC